jgi:hypothetical protein
MDCTSDVVDVSRLAKSMGISRRCLMSADALGLSAERGRAKAEDQVAATAMGILFWLKRAWAPHHGDTPPRVFEAKTGQHEGRQFEVQVIEDSILVGISS